MGDRFTKQELDEVRSRHPIDEVLSRLGFELPARANAGVDYMIRCPSLGHEDRTPSCVVHPGSDRFHCFGCGAHGDVIDLVRTAAGGRTFREALDFLDRTTTRGGSPLIVAREAPRRRRSTTSPDVDHPDLERTSLCRVLEVNAAAWSRLTEPAPRRVAHRYLERRGLDMHALEELLATPLVGYTPAARDGLAGYLSEAGFTLDEVVDAGWAIRSVDGVRDRFRRRMVLPVRDREGNVVGVIGRDTTESATHKYLNMPQTVAYDKGACLYSPYKELLVARTVVVSEGPIDALAIAAHAAADRADRGTFPLAVSGTALTQRHARLIRDLRPHAVVVCADGDEPGRRAAESWQQRLAEVGLRATIAEMPAGQDAASLLSFGRYQPEFGQTARGRGITL